MAGQEHASWTPADKKKFVEFLLGEKVASAGDGGTFKPSVWTAAAVEMEKYRSKGGQKTAKSCSSKYQHVSSHFF